MRARVGHRAVINAARPGWVLPNDGGELDGGIPFTAQACEANASFDSMMSKSAIERPVFFIKFLTASTGPIPITSGATPACP